MKDLEPHTVATQFRVDAASSKAVQRPQQEPEDSGWLITLSDLTLLLLCFLTVWYIVGQSQTNRQPVRTPAPNQTPQPLRVDAHEPAELNSVDWQALREEIESYVRQLGLSQDVSTTSEHDEILISLTDPVPFDSGKAELRLQALPLLEKLAALVVSRPSVFVEINGHTDDVPISNAKFPSNWELSASRASRVARYLIEKGVHPGRLAVQGFASNRPRRPNSTPNNRSANRRVEIRLYQNAHGERESVGNQTVRQGDKETRRLAQASHVHRGASLAEQTPPAQKKVPVVSVVPILPDA